MWDEGKQPVAAATMNGAASNDLVGAFTSHLASQLQAFRLTLVSEFEKHISVLQEENQRLRKQLLASNGVADFDGRSVSQPHDKFASDINSLVTCKPVAIGDVDADCPGPLPCKPIAIGANTSGDDSSESANPKEADNDSLVDPRPSFMRQVSPFKQATYRRAPPMMRHQTAQVWQNTSSPPSSSPAHNQLQMFVFSKGFEILSAGTILLNTAVMALQMQYDGFDAGYDLEWKSYSEPAKQTWPWMNGFKMAASIFFNVLFCAELILRIAAAGRLAFCQLWIGFDAVVVGSSMMDLVLPSGSIPVNPGMMRVIRLVRLVRLLKLLKTMTAFDSLFLLLKAVKASVHAALWSFLMLATIQLITGLFLCQILFDYVKNEDNPLESRKEIFKYFGSFSRTMLTMFEITFGNWVVCCRILIEHVSEWFMPLFLAYRCFFCFAVLKVISAVFITETNRVLEHDDELTLMKKNREKLLITHKVHSLIQNLEQNNSGAIGWDAFEKIAQDGELGRMLVPLGFEIHDLEKLFWLLQDTSGRVKIDELLHKLGRLRGSAKSIDSQTLIKITHRIEETLHNVLQQQGYEEEQGAEQKAIGDKACSM